MYSAILCGLRISLYVGLTSTVLSAVFDTLMGLVAGYLGGKTDAVIMRAADIQLSFPAILIALTIMAIWGQGLFKIIVAISIVNWVFYARTARGSARKTAVELLSRVGIPSPHERLRDYPHQFSGGMRQRVVISIAMASDPDLIIADEPSTALDVTIQAQVLTLLRNLVRRQAAAMILITHDIALVGQFCDEICVMYAGHLVEKGTKEQVIRRPGHPYTQGLIGSIPGRQARRKRLKQIPGMMPNLIDMPPGCPFHPRCPEVFDRCRHERPQLLEPAIGRQCACHLYHGRRPRSSREAACGRPQENRGHHEV